MAENVSMKIKGSQWREFSDLEIHQAIDSHATVGFYAPFEPERKDIRDTFRPFSFHPLELFVDAERLFTGVQVDVIPTTEAEMRTLSVSGYSRPAELEKNNPPVSLSLPVEANGLTLRQIAERLAGAFGIGVVMDGPDGPPFKRVKMRLKRLDTTADQDQTIDSFLVELGKQRGFVRSSTASGELLFQHSVAPGNPVARFREGEPPLTSVMPTFDPQSYYSEITGFTSTKRGRVGNKYTERNQRMAGGVLRSMSFRLDDIERADAPAAVKAKIARMFANAFTVVLNLPTWRDPHGNLYRPNTTVKLQAPGAMVYRETEFLVRDVYLKQNGDEETSSLGCVLPGAFSGQQPDVLPWEDA
jgi:prophage tail gpP-like protein